MKNSCTSHISPSAESTNPLGATRPKEMQRTHPSDTTQKESLQKCNLQVRNELQLMKFLKISLPWNTKQDPTFLLVVTKLWIFVEGELVCWEETQASGNCEGKQTPLNYEIASAIRRENFRKLFH